MMETAVMSEDILWLDRNDGHKCHNWVTFDCMDQDMMVLMSGDMGTGGMVIRVDRGVDFHKWAFDSVDDVHVGNRDLCCCLMFDYCN